MGSLVTLLIIIIIDGSGRIFAREPTPLKRGIPMPLNQYWEVFAVGFVGGILLELLHWYNIYRTPEFPGYARSPKYWIVSFLMAVAGGLVALFYFGPRTEAMIALHVGLSTPLILQKLAVTAAEPPGAKGPGLSVASFFRW